MLELDANFLIAVLREDARATRSIQPWLARNDIISMSAVAWSEFLCGPLLTEEKEDARKVISKVEAFSVQDATLAAELFNSTGRRSRSHADCMIAAGVIRRGSTLATFDRPGFERFRSFKLKLVAA